MTQRVDFQFGELLRSSETNQRFGDITGPGILHGFKLMKGTSSFSLTLSRNGFNESVAFTPTGAKVAENTDLIDVLTLEANTASSGLPRIDNVYLVYQPGTATAQANYVVVKGENNNVQPQNPNIRTHLLLGSVQVFPNNEPVAANMISTVSPGFAKLEVAGTAFFHGEAEFDKPVVFRQGVTFMDGTSGGGGGGSTASTYYDVLPAPIITTEGQTDFTLPSSYSVGKNALFVYLDGSLVPRSKVIETSDTTFRLTHGSKDKQSLDAYWYKSLSTFTPQSHNHDADYYKKFEVANRLPKAITDYFNGTNGRSIVHNLGHQNYDVVSIIPLGKTFSIGSISVEKGDNDFKVYNQGAVGDKFVATYIVRNNLDYAPTPEHLGEYSVFSKDWNATAGVYTRLEYKRKDGTLYMSAMLSNPNAQNRFTTVTAEYYNSDSSKVIRKELWALAYDVDGRAISKVLQSIIQ